MYKVEAFFLYLVPNFIILPFTILCILELCGVPTVSIPSSVGDVLGIIVLIALVWVIVSACICIVKIGEWTEEDLVKTDSYYKTEYDSYKKEFKTEKINKYEDANHSFSKNLFKILLFVLMIGELGFICFIVCCVKKKLVFTIFGDEGCEQ